MTEDSRLMARTGIAFFALLLMLPVAACSEGPAAERQYELQAKNNPSEPQCAPLTKVAEAYLRDENDAKYREWNLKAKIACLNEATERQLEAI